MFVYRKEYESSEARKTSGLFRMMQDTAGEHCELLGLGTEVTGPKNLMWVVVRQFLELSRYPDPGETLELHTWPGPSRHMFFPRFYQFKTPAGELLGQGSALWTLVDRSSRKMIRPAAYGLELEGLVTGEECRLPTAPGKLPTDRADEYTVAAEVLDGNGHMNNTRYYDLAERLFGESVAAKRLGTAMTEYVSEAREGDQMRLHWGRDGDRYFIVGSTGEDKILFRMRLEYV